MQWFWYWGFVPCTLYHVQSLVPRTLYMEGKHSISELDAVPENLSLVDLRSLWELYAPRAHAKEPGHFLDQTVQQAAMACCSGASWIRCFWQQNSFPYFWWLEGQDLFWCTGVKVFLCLSLCSRWLASVFLVSLFFLRCCPNSIFSQICLLFWIVAHHHDPIFNLITHSRSFLIES